MVAHDVTAPHERRDIAAAIASAIVVFVFYVWLVSGGQWTSWPTYSDYYQRLADAFRHGQTYLLEQPHPALLAMPDPYDPVANRALALHDASLFRCRYYLYWGPVPAVLVAVANVITCGARIPDQLLVFTFCCGTVLAAAVLLTRIRRRHFPTTPPWTTALGVLAVGLASPTPFNLSRPMVYEASIHAAQCFIVAGVLFATVALGDERRRRWAIFAAAACLALATGSRASMSLAVVGVAGCVAWKLRRNVLDVSVLALPLVSAAVALGAYNHARFGSPFEPGIRYQLAGFNSPREYGRLASARNVLPNLMTYCLELAPEAELFPYLRKPRGELVGAADYVRRPVQRVGRSVPVGTLLAAPMVLFAAVPLFVGRREISWHATMLGVCVVLAAVPSLLLTPTSQSMRYQADWAPALMILATIGVWAGLKRFEERGDVRRAILAAALILGGATILVALQLSVTRTPSHFDRNRPQSPVDPERQ
jgi:hypothetical protein